MDVAAQAHYLASAASRAVALRFLNDFDAALVRLREFPRIGTLWPSDNPELQGLRRLQMRTFPVSIFYLDREPHVEIVRVLHGNRDLPALLDEP